MRIASPSLGVEHVQPASIDEFLELVSTASFHQPHIQRPLQSPHRRHSIGPHYDQPRRQTRILGIAAHAEPKLHNRALGLGLDRLAQRLGIALSALL